MIAVAGIIHLFVMTSSKYGIPINAIVCDTL